MGQNENGSKVYLFSIVMVAVIGGLLFGYDTAVISGAEKGLQAFFLGSKDFAYTDFYHGFTCSSALIGCIIGSALSGVCANGLGRKRSLIIAGLFFFLSALGSYNPEFLFYEYGKPTFSLLVAFNFYRILGGLGVGLASAICPMYIAEVAPSNIRGTLVSWNQFAIIFGQLVVYMVNFFILGSHTNPEIQSIGHGLSQVLPNSDPWTVATGWRYMFGSEAFPAGLFSILICFVPETPRYLAMTGKESKALYVLERINGKLKAKEILDDIKNTVTEKSEKMFTYGALVIFVGIINISFTLIAIFTVEKWGRKPLLITGSLGMAIGAAGVAISFGSSPMVTMVSIMFYSASFMMSWGPICWVLIAEIFPNTIRGKAVAVAVAFQWIFNWIVSSTFVPMFNMSVGGNANFGHVFTYSLDGAICVLAAIFVWKLVPETKGKTLEDMSKLWKKDK